jgi:NADH dehydrogenase
MTTQTAKAKKKIVILGAGFGGLECCKRLRDRPDLDIVLIDRQNHHLFQPLLYQVATAGLAAPDIAQPVRAILAKQENARVLMEEVQDIPLTRKCVVTHLREIPYDYLVIALGVRTGYFGHPEWAHHCIGLKSLAEATAIRASVLDSFERAEANEDPAEVARLMTIVVVGGGPTGVELAGSFAELSKKALRGNFRNIDPSTTRIVLIEAGPRLLSMYSERLSAYAKRKLCHMGVEVMVNSAVEEVGEGFVKVPAITIQSDNIIWAAGTEAPEITRKLGVKLDRSGRIIVEKDLSIPSHPEVFVIGDIASAVDGNNLPVPPLAPAAIQMGDHVAALIHNETRVAHSSSLAKSVGLLRGDFKYRDKGTMATIGKSAAVASSMGLNLTGFIAWFMWLAIHLLLLVGLRNKLAVLLSWLFAYIRYNPGARIITSVRTDSSHSS